MMRTTEPNVYAIGDITPHPWLAHCASAQGLVAVEHIAGKNPRPLNYDRIPGGTYCYPEVASVGLTEKKAKERGYDVKVGTFPFSAITKASISDEGIGMVKIVSDKKYDEILGVHLIGPQGDGAPRRGLRRAAARVDHRGARAHRARAPDALGDHEGSGRGDAGAPDSHLSSRSAASGNGGVLTNACSTRKGRPSASSEAISRNSDSRLCRTPVMRSSRMMAGMAFIRCRKSVPTR